MCHYCHNLGYVRQHCRKLHNKNRRFHFVNHQKSLNSASTSINTLVESGKTNTFFSSSSSTWVMDSRATDHMTGNSSLFTTFQSHSDAKEYLSKPFQSFMLQHGFSIRPRVLIHVLRMG